MMTYIYAVPVFFQGYHLTTAYDSYPWTKCNAFEATKKNCPRGETCLRMKRFNYAWNWAMRCKSKAIKIPSRLLETLIDTF